MALVELKGFPRLSTSVVSINAIRLIQNHKKAHLKVDFTGDMRALSNPGIISAYFHIYRRTGERYGIADILMFLRLLLPCLCGSQHTSAGYGLQSLMIKYQIELEFCL